MSKKTIGMAFVVIGGVAVVAAVLKMAAGYLPVAVNTSVAKIPSIPSANNGVNAAVGVGAILVGYYLKK